MSEASELVIRDLLIAEGTSERVANSLIKRLESSAPSRKERISFVHFLIHCGHYKEVLKLYAVWFKEELPMPLYPFYSLLHRSGFKPGEEFIRQVIQAHESCEEADQIQYFIPWEALDSRFIEIKKNITDHYLEKQKQRKIRHLEKLEYLRNNRMIDEEERLLDELLVLYPEERQLKDDKKNFKERWARAILAKKSYESFDELSESTAPTFSVEELATGKIIYSSALELAKSKPLMAYNLTIALYFLDLYSEAYEVLKLAPSDPPSDWLRLELLLKSRRFVECLDACLNIETKYATDPETVFGTTYYRALALYGIGQITTAKDLLRSLVTIRPNYRSAHSLLMKWGG